VEEISKYIQDTISSSGNPEKAKWLENYVKHDIKSKGVGIPEIRQIVKNTNSKFNISKEPVNHQTEILQDLMKSEFTEDKLAAILYLQLFWKNKNESITLDLISQWFDSKFITDWNVCDWLCVRVLSPMVDNSSTATINELSKWNENTNLWKARASLVPFAQSKTLKLHKNVVFEFAVKLIQREERFCKTAVGWTLREYSKFDNDSVKEFLANFDDWMTKEVIRNATKYIKK
jgi:3-methyladenine DNA glycosylase AlkD